VHRILIMAAIATQWKSLQAPIREHKTQLGFSLRVTIAALLSFALSYWMRIPLPLWTVLTAVILTQASFGRSVKATTDYLVSTLCGAVYAGAVAVLLPHGNQVALAGVLAIAVAPLALLAAVHPSFGAATFTGVLVLLVPGIAHVGPIESAVYRVLEVAVGGVTALIVSLLVVPVRAHALAIEAAGQMLDLMARALPDLFAGLLQERDPAAIRSTQDGIGHALARLDLISAETKHERVGFLGAEFDPGPLLRTLLRLRHDLVMIGRAAARPLPEPFRAQCRPLLTQVGEAVSHYLCRSAAALVARGGPPPLDVAEAAAHAYADAFAKARREGLTRDLPVEAVERIFTLSFALDQLREHLRDLERCVREAAVTR
jgi:uncharacterized membrane protein YccC